ncbi:XdhC family protein [Streptomyces sp. NBC_00457]|uniref:XdhC family protein n=1 Tax=Streptomyces sp. NBC_00457 TaxID=2975748 RepID=UPI002E1F751F
MLDLATELTKWTKEGRDFAVATVISVSGSAPRPPGAALAVDTTGTVIGSVSGGCVEGAVYDLCVEALENGKTVVERFGYSDEDAFAVGLTCGGVIEVLVTPITGDTPDREVYEAALSRAAQEKPTELARVISGPTELVGKPVLVPPQGRGELRDQPQRTRTVELDDRTLFIETHTPPPRMIIFGAIDFAAALTRTGKFLGYHVTVCDARPVFATRARFPEADEIVVEWPDSYLRRTETDERTVLCVLTHDAKFDVPLLETALRLPAAYVGAMGSRRTHEDRNRRLREVGLTESELAGLRSPIGLDLGARSPEETALSIAAEIVAARHGGTGVPLTDSGTPIHRAVATSRSRRRARSSSS